MSTKSNLSAYTATSYAKDIGWSFAVTDLWFFHPARLFLDLLTHLRRAVGDNLAFESFSSVN